MSFNGVHFLEGGHVDIAESTNIAPWLCNFAAYHATSSFILILALLLTFGCMLSFDAQFFFLGFAHHVLRVRAQLPAGVSEVEVEGRGQDAGFGRGFLREARRLARLWIDVDEAKS